MEPLVCWKVYSFPRQTPLLEGKGLCSRIIIYIIAPKFLNWPELAEKYMIPSTWLLIFLKTIMWILVIVQNDRARDKSGIQKCLPVVSGFEQPLFWGNDIEDDGICHVPLSSLNFHFMFSKSIVP